MKLSALLLLFVAVASETSLAQPGAGKSHGTPFSITIKADPSSVIQIGQKLLIAITLTNLSDHPIDAPTAWFDGTYAFDAAYRFDIRDSTGKQIPWAAPDTVTFINDAEAGTLDPGNSKSEEIDIQEFFNLKKPGSYTVQAMRRAAFKNPDSTGKVTADLTKGDIKSNVITITVVAAKPEGQP